jgi:chromosome partitioning protein
VFCGGSPNAPKLYAEAGEAVTSFGIGVVPWIVADRAVFRHATGQGKTVMELDPGGKASQEVRALYKWACQQVTMQKKDNAA